MTQVARKFWLALVLMLKIKSLVVVIRRKTYILAFGSECLIPGDPAAKSSDPMEAACPTHQVEMGGRTYCMVS